MTWPGAFALAAIFFSIFGSFAVSEYSKNMASIAAENAKLTPGCPK